MNSDKPRDYSFDILKCLAALLVTHSHIENVYGDYAVLATGGSFGDCLFFFCSGYTLLLSRRNLNFANWYKRRISRIYPTVFSWALLLALFFHSHMNMAEILLYGGGFFVSCIMVFYVLFYGIKKFVCGRNMLAVMAGVFLLCWAAYPFVDKGDVDAMYKWQWSLYFIPMLLGAMLGKQYAVASTTIDSSTKKIVMLLSGLVVSVAAYYIFMHYINTVRQCDFFRPLIILPQLGVTVCFYLLCRTSFAERLYSNRYCYAFIRFVGGLCLEIYIVQPIIIRNWPLTELFPLNVVIVFLIIVFSAYVLKCLSHVWSQTFKETDYNWQEIVKPW